jgi:MHS family proline/betaine transporter-like MFS transporter
MSTKRTRVIVAGIAGNVMEWYDFAVYGYFAMAIGQHFFPSDDPATSLIASFGAFAAGFLMRPVGSLFFGHVGDKFGRKRALTISVMMMALPTFIIGVLPGHDQIGVAAAVLMVAMRMLQGASVGGEYTTSIAFLAEHSPPARRGFFTSWSIWGAVAGILLGSAVGALFSALLTEQEIMDWGWRLPFLGGILIGVVGFYIRRHVMEEEVVSERPSSPVKESFRLHWRDLLRIAGMSLVGAVAFYMIFIYVASWLQSVVHVSKSRALDINTLNMALMLVIIPIAAIISDRIGRKPVLIVSISGLVLLSYPFFWLMHHDSDVMITLGQMGFTVLAGTLMGVFPAALVEMAPARVRITVMSVGYNLTLGLFGGTAPMLSTWLVETTHRDLSPALYLSAAALVSLVVALSLREGAGLSLSEEVSARPPDT